MIDPTIPLPARIRRVVRETADTVTIHLAPPDSAFTADLRPGQFHMLYLFGVGEVAISISGNSRRRDDVAHTIRAVGSVTRPITALRRGDVVGVRGPYGSVWPIEEARGRDLLLVAGGIGLAPLRPVVREVIGRRREFGRVTILYGARLPADLLFRRDLERWEKRRGIDLRITVDRGDEDWAGEVGTVTSLLSNVRIDPGATLAMVCGPEVMMRFTLRELGAAGIPPEEIYLSMERNMKCAIGICGRCQFGPSFVCKDGPVLRFDRIARFFGKREF